MSQSPELAGGEGFTFEGDASAFYLTALLSEAYAPGIDERIVVKVAVQQRDFGEPLDDLIVDFEDPAKNPARLSLQVKRALTISNAKTNTDFREVIRDSWATFQKPNFRSGLDRYGAAVGEVSRAKERALKTLCDWARESLTASHFQARFEGEGSASKEAKAIYNNIVGLLDEVGKGESCSAEEVHLFLAHFVLIQFDFLREGATDPPEAMNRIRECLLPEDASKAPLVWSKMVQLARSSAGKSGEFDRPRLVRLISPLARLQGANSMRSTLAQLKAIATSSAYLIPDDVGGTKLDRPLLLESLDHKLSDSRVVQVRGLPGSGKSVLLRRAVQRALDLGSTIFLKAEQIVGSSWASYATSQGLPSHCMEHLLVEIEATGTPILFIDAIDRIEKEQQPVVLELLNTIVKSPLLEDWRIIVSLRDTSLEMLRNWLGEFLAPLRISTLNVDQLNDEEATTLANAKPHLRPLLFGTESVRAVVRRPFFAKILNQNHANAPEEPPFTPQSEIDLIENWWKRGGFNEAGQSALERQKALIEMGRVRALNLSHPIRLSQLSSIDNIQELANDGILQIERSGLHVRFSHDIFFEWSFYYVLADKGMEWIEEIKACGEPPSVARVVELLSQREYEQGGYWGRFIPLAERPEIRSQWLRAWLLAPLGMSRFDVAEDQFASVVFADDLRLFRKALVWFQAEKTTPNSNILSSSIPQEQRQQLADLLGWPSDLSAWRRLIDFILRHISDVPYRLYPEVIAIFEVWQNALSETRNTTSGKILTFCDQCLSESDSINDDGEESEHSVDWSKPRIPRSVLETSEHLILRAARAEPGLVSEYLQRVTRSKNISAERFRGITLFSPILCETLPERVVELSLAFLLLELPDETVLRARRERHEEAEIRSRILAKPEAERTREDRFAISTGQRFLFGDDFGHHAWKTLSLHDNLGCYYPPSPLREPFHSLFRSRPDEGIRLLRELCNHAMSAWCQLHKHSHESPGNPLPLELHFPWDTQLFWGTDREYGWFRATWAPHPIGSGFMALEEWCFAELERGRTADELIEQVIRGNQCIAICGIAAVVALQTETFSEVTFPIFTSQRLLSADHARWAADLSRTASLIGFNSKDRAHFEAVKASNSRPVRNTELRQKVPGLIFAPPPLGERARNAMLSFRDALPYQYEEQRHLTEEREHLFAEAIKYAELADLQTYKAYRTSSGSDEVAIVHVSPSASLPENIALVETATKRLSESSLWTWADKSFEMKAVQDEYSIEQAITFAREFDGPDLFTADQNEDMMSTIASGAGIRRGAVAATAAITLNFRDNSNPADIEWAREVLARALRLPETPGIMWSPQSILPWHQAIYVARGLGADLHHENRKLDVAHALLGLVAHPLEVVSLTAIDEACKLWESDSNLTWAALSLAYSLCNVPPRSHNQHSALGEMLHSPDEAKAAVDEAFAFYTSSSKWKPLPLPPPAWLKANSLKGASRSENYNEGETNEGWVEPDGFWHSKFAAEILNRIPLEAILNSAAKEPLLSFLEGVLDWTKQKHAPPWSKPGRRLGSIDRMFELTYALGSRIGKIAGLLPIENFQGRLLNPILELEGDTCWALLSPLVDSYICSYVYDAKVIPENAVLILELCLERFLKAPVFDREGYRGGEFTNSDQISLAQCLMFVSVERAGLAARYVNGNWSEISRILPLVDRLIRAGGWTATVMGLFLTLCERAKDHYPAEAFADQVLGILAAGTGTLKGWTGTLIPARIAELVQFFAHREVPMNLALAQQFLRILDLLVDMGDRRSAALQLSESFREIRLSTVESKRHL